MNDLLMSLTEILPPPESPEENRGDWDSAEARLGTLLPSDYKRFVGIYGTGGIVTEPNLDILWILNPFSENISKNLIDGALGLTEYFRSQDMSEWPKKYDVFPEPNGLLAWGQCLDGNTIFWRMRGPPDEWWIEYDETRGPDRFLYPDKTFITFLLALTQRKLQGVTFGYGPCRFLTVNQVREDRKRPQ